MSASPIDWASAGNDAKNNISNLLGSLLWKNPVNSGSQYYDQIPGELNQNLGPYANAGSNILPMLLKSFSGLTNDPGGALNAIGANFHASPGYNFTVNQALGAANRAGSASGMLGSPMEQQGIASTVNDLANKNYYDYLTNSEDLLKTGLSGAEGIYNTGANSANSLASLLASAFMNRGNLAIAGQNLNNQNNQGTVNSLTNLLI